MPTKCGYCESNKLSIGERLGTYYLGCDECSETVRIFTPDEVIDLLESTRATAIVN